MPKMSKPLCRHDVMAGSGISDQLIKLYSTDSWITYVLSSSASYFVVCYFQCKIFNTTKLLNHMAPFVELIMKNEQSDTDNHRIM